MMIEERERIDKQEIYNTEVRWRKSDRKVKSPDINAMNEKEDIKYQSATEGKKETK